LKRSSLRDCGVGRATDAAARQLLLLLLGRHNDVAGRDEGRLRRCEDCQVVVLLMDVVARSLRLDAALEAAIVAVVRCIGDA
jgi:hypothetical protein